MSRSVSSSLNPRPEMWVWFWTLALSALATALTMVLYLRYRDVDIWRALEPARAFLHPTPSDPVFPQSIFRTRANSWSNLAYVYVGIYALVAGYQDWRERRTDNYLVATPAMSFIFGLSCIYLGIGSGIFHASLTRWGQQLDVAAMYSTLVALLALNGGRHWPRIASLPAWPVWISLAVVVDVLLYIYKWQMQSTVVLPGLILGVLAFGIMDRFRKTTRTDVRWLYGGTYSLVLAVCCRILDVRGPLAYPEVWLTGHALWHVATAASLGCMYVYYRRERVSAD